MDLTATKHKNLVFTSAGDFSNVRLWLNRHKNFDLYIVNYGSDDNGLEELADFYLHHCGGKFPNLHHVWTSQPELLNTYESILVMDDDVVINCEDINKLFDIRKTKDLWVLQAAFLSSGIVRHEITRKKAFSHIRYTNFVEMTCPLFRTDKLLDFLSIYDPVLVGWGTDEWFLHNMGPELKGHIAIVDDINCINPRTRPNSPIREINKLQSDADREAHWLEIIDTYGISSHFNEKEEYSREKAPISLTAIKTLLNNFAYRIYDRISFIIRRLLELAGF